MGNQQNIAVKTSDIAHQNSQEQEVLDDVCSDSNPLQNFLTRCPNLPVRTLSDIKNKYQQLKTHKSTPPMPKVAFKPFNKLLCSSGQISPDIQDTYYQAILTEHNALVGQALLVDCMDQMPKKKLHQFKDVIINFQNFITVKQERIEPYYQLKEILGQGSYGQVFRAICCRTNQERAIKMLKGKYMKQNNKKQLLAQLTLLSKLRHPCIITLYDLFFYNNKYYVVMEYCKGGNVSQTFSQLKNKNKSQKMIMSIMKQLLSVLNYLHSQNIVHRDIKLDNMVFLNPVSSQTQDQYIPIKIIDFGLAVESRFQVVRNFPGAGTMAYIAPEVLTSVLTTKSDIWSAAVLMTILLTGISPFKALNVQQIKQNVKKKQLNFNERPFKSMPALAKELVQKMFNRNFHKRITAAEALQSPWFSQNQSIIPLQPTLIVRLQKHQKSDNLVSIVETFLSLRRISQQQRQKIAAIFQAVDKDHSGLIQCHQLIEIYRKQRQDVSEEQVLAIVNSIDKNKSGKIDFNQFLILMCDREKLFLQDSLSQAFDFFDKDKTGFIQVKELKYILRGSEKAQVEYLVKQLDTDGDSKISRQEFVKYLQAY